MENKYKLILVLVFIGCSRVVRFCFTSAALNMRFIAKILAMVAKVNETKQRKSTFSVLNFFSWLPFCEITERDRKKVSITKL